MKSIPEKTIDRVEQLMNVDLKGQALADYQQQIIVMLVEVMRITNGDQFTLGFLHGAVKHVETSKPFIKAVRTH